MGSLGHWPTPGSTRHLASAPGRSRSGCSTTATAAPTAPVVGGQSVPPNANGQGSNRRSDDGQTIFTGNRMAQERGPDLVFLVELSGLEPLTSCMPCRPNSSARVAGRLVPARQPSSGVWLGPAPAARVWWRSHLVCHWRSGPHPGGETPGKQRRHRQPAGTAQAGRG